MKGGLLQIRWTEEMIDLRTRVKALEKQIEGEYGKPLRDVDISKIIRLQREHNQVHDRYFALRKEAIEQALAAEEAEEAAT